MNYLKQIECKLFVTLFSKILYILGWKRKTVQANLNHITEHSFYNIANDPKKFKYFYKNLLNNLSYHLGELLFNFNSYKKLPDDFNKYPYKCQNTTFCIDKNSISILNKMKGGGIFLSAHYGNYEASGAWLCALNIPLKASFIPLKPKWLNQLVYNKIRSVKGRPYSMEAKTPRDFLKVLDRGELFCLLADQDSRIESAKLGKLFNKNTRINPLPDFLINHRPHTPVYFCWIEESTSQKTLYATEAKDFSCQNLNENSKAKIPIVDGPYHNWLQKQILKEPSLWYGWTHRRFYSVNPEIYTPKK